MVAHCKNSGNIRSVNVDYFGLTQALQVGQQVEEEESFDVERKLARQSKQILSPNDSSSSSSSYSSSSASFVASNELSRRQTNETIEPLEAAVLQVLESNYHSKSEGVEVSFILENLKLSEKWSLSEHSIEEVDWALARLIESGRLVSQPIELLQNSTGRAQSRVRRSHKSSNFSDRLLKLSWPLGEGKSRVSLDARRESSASTVRSKSTTLDSGIGHLDLQSEASHSQQSQPAREELSLESNSLEGRRMLQQEPLRRQLAAGSPARERPARAEQRRGYSLARSFSVRPSSLSAAAARRFAASKSVDRWQEGQKPEGHEYENGQFERRQQQQARTGVIEEVAASQLEERRNLSSLFRSKSVRVISSGKERNGAGEQLRPAGYAAATTTSSNKQATIDYLAPAQPHKRTFSIRRNSLLAFNSKDDSFVANNGGKIVLFLRKLFSIRRSQRRAAPEALADNHQQHHYHHHHHHRIVAKQQIIKEHFVGAPAEFPSAAAPRSRWAPQQAGRRNSNQVQFAQQQPPLPAKQHITSVSPSSSSSSGSSSLIEILDCSSAVNSSRRPLRQEKLVNISNNSARATTFRLMRRSESSLSHNSDKSNASSTTNSTVSQQLRKHLDEAYKRHRNCTNQREKEFIDSITVLRHASRYALQPSSPCSQQRRSSACSKSKSTSGSSSSSSRSPNNRDTDDTASSVISSNCCSTPRNEHHKPPHLSAPLSPAASAESHNGGGASLASNQQPDLYGNHHHELYSNSNNSNHNRNKQSDLNQGDLLAGAGELCGSAAERKHQQLGFELANRDHQQAAQNRELSQWLHESSLEGELRERRAAEPARLPPPNPDDCSICTSYMNSVARLCPLASPAAASFCPVAGPACCPSQHLPSSPEAMSEYCCPIWRSMVYNYYPPPPTTHNTNYQPPAAAPQHFLQQELAPGNPPNQEQQLNNQHNTTIDLKIEIGADFKRSKRQAVKGARRQLQLPDQRHNLRLVPEVRFNGNCVNDSLESSDLTDESLNVKLLEEFGHDTCETSGGELSSTSSSNKQTGSQSDSSSNNYRSLYHHQHHRATLSTDEEQLEQESLPSGGLVVR